MRGSRRDRDSIKIRNESRTIISDCTEIKWVIREYYEQLYANKIDNLDKKEKFPEIYK